MTDIPPSTQSRDYQENEFIQAVGDVMTSVAPVMEKAPEYRRHGIVERLVEPERIITFRVPWMDDMGRVRVNRGFRIEMNSAIGPYKGGLRFHPSVNQSILKFLAFEHVFKNALTTLPLGGGAGGSDFEPKGKSDGEVMRFCQSFMAELFRHIGANTDVPEGDIGVGSREIGYLFGMYRKLRNQFTGVLTGKGLGWGGSLIRPEAAGFGCVYFAARMLATRSDGLSGKTCLISGSGNVAQATARKLIEMGAHVVTFSDSSGHIFDDQGIDAEKLEFVKHLKNVRRGRISEYIDQYAHAVFTPAAPEQPSNPLWQHRAQCVFPCATQNEINKQDAYHLINNNIKLVCEGASMPCTLEARDIFLDKGILYAPSKAANAGGVAVSGLEMTQNRIRLNWLGEEVDNRLKIIMKGIHDTCLAAAEAYDRPGNYFLGANIAGFVKVADAMLDQGVI
ncbi:glutamate dehydrogenase [Desulfosarcina alkanivorans]|uniref:Glutamate dehydrogenase n=1 Tax=Desulfosarcina alkanivorans TaxID=571177 RepID=A0A5K7YUQ2_9BACT|nr:NADP-specific glutamate dehydrogenase [Desulfosarcina alkanivorans]BBO70751.1 glutamate dehydrogenase [Desulfosarcina alkanivorans]